MQITPLILPPAPRRAVEHDNDLIQSLSRGIGVLRSFGAQNHRMTMAEVAKVTGLTRAAARRILLTLEKLGYVRSDARYYCLTARVLELGQGFLEQPLWHAIKPQLVRLSHALNETVSASVLDAHDVIYTIRVRSSRILQLELREGGRLPAFASSAGRVLLAGLSPIELNHYFRTATFTRFTRFTIVEPSTLRAKVAEVRAQGWSHVRDEMEGGISGAAVPLLDASGRTIAALSVGTNSDRTSVHAAKTMILPLLSDTAAAIRKELEAIDAAARSRPQTNAPHVETPESAPESRFQGKAHSSRRTR